MEHILVFEALCLSLYIPRFLSICRREDSSSQDDIKCHSGLSATRLMKRLTKRMIDIYCLEIKNLNQMELLLRPLFFWPSYLVYYSGADNTCSFQNQSEICISSRIFSNAFFNTLKIYLASLLFPTFLLVKIKSF